MSLEAAILENTATMKALIAAMNAVGLASASAAAVGHAGPIEAKTATKEVEVKKPAVTQPAVETPAATPETATASPSEPITYDRVGKAITDGVKVNRNAVIATLEKFGAKKGPDLKPEQYADFLAELAQAAKATEAAQA